LEAQLWSYYSFDKGGRRRYYTPHETVIIRRGGEGGRVPATNKEKRND
jgi:hypothetical protein